MGPKTRCRMITVRLSDEEYTRLKNLCHTTGARSVSDLARSAMNTLLQTAGTEADVTTHLQNVHAQIQTLDRKIDTISDRLFKSEIGQSAK